MSEDQKEIDEAPSLKTIFALIEAPFLNKILKRHQERSVELLKFVNEELIDEIIFGDPLRYFEVIDNIKSRINRLIDSQDYFKTILYYEANKIEGKL